MDTPWLIAPIALILLTLGRFAITWTFTNRLKSRVTPAFAALAAQHGWRQHDPPGLLKLVIADHRAGKLAGHPLDLIAYRRVPSSWSVSWSPWLILQVRINPGAIQLYPQARTTPLWSYDNPMLGHTSAALKRSLDGATDLDPGEPLGLPEVGLAGLNTPLPDEVTAAIQRAVKQGSFWIGDNRMVIARICADDVETQLTEMVADATTLTAWLEQPS